MHYTPDALEIEHVGPLHRLDARAKIIGFLTLAVACSVTPLERWPALAGLGAMTLLLWALSYVPPLYVIKRLLVPLPLLLSMALFLPFMEHRPALLSDVAVGGLVVPGSGLQSLLEVALKIAICVPALALLSGTTPMPELLAGFERLRAPRLFVSLVGFTWRYVFVLIDEFARLRRAREARGFGGSRWFNLVTTGRIIGTTFIRSFERAERVYQAMLARGFTGSLPAGAAPRLRPADVAFALGVAGASVSLALFAR